MHRSNRSHRTRASRIASISAALVCLVSIAGPAYAADDLADMSLEDLMNVTVTSATKREQSKADVAAAITVLTSEDIRRSGATSIPEALRMVPGMNVARVDAHRWAISVRGFNNQFANKLLVLIDGRVVYTPLFGGVYWDVQDTVIGDIDRIEVIRGPGGTLWGANAVNGVINITTKSAKDTEGIYAMGLAGNQEYVGEGRFGSNIGDHTSYRVFGRGFKRDDFTVPGGSPYPAHDEWYQWRVGARIDSQLGDDDLVTLQGDFYDGAEEALGGLTNGHQPAADDEFRGGNVLARWTHTLGEMQSLQVQAYWDQTQRAGAQSAEDRNTVDVLAQHDFALGSANEWLFNWGVEYFWTGDETTPGASSNFDPPEEDFHRFSGFLQIQLNLFDEDLQIIGGTKLEWNNYTDFEYQPTGRVLWRFIDDNAVWTSVSRAVRAPTRSERDIAFGGVINGNKDFQSEDLLAVEGGYRNMMIDGVTLDFAAFWNKYTDQPALLSNTFENATEAKSMGGEFEVTWEPMEGLRFITSYSLLKIKEDVATGAASIQGDTEGMSPMHTWMLRGLWNLPVAPVELDAAVWYVGELDGLFDPTAGLAPTPGTSPTIDSYWRLDLRLGWQALDWLALDVVGQNLTEESHMEFGEGLLVLFPGTYVPRSYYGRVTLTF